MGPISALPNIPCFRCNRPLLSSNPSVASLSYHILLVGYFMTGFRLVWGLVLSLLLATGFLLPNRKPVPCYAVFKGLPWWGAGYFRPMCYFSHVVSRSPLPLPFLFIS